LDEDFRAGDFFVEDFFDDFFEDDFFDEDFFGGTFAPFLRALDRPIAIACFLLLTFLPEPPLFSFPFLRSRIALPTSSDDFLLYFAIVALL
jgi:hypothetical protein